jgi:predicted permease
MRPGRSHGLLLTIARRVCRGAVPASLWPIVDDELLDELSEREQRGWPRWRRDLWGAAQYLSVAARLGVDRFIPGGAEGPDGGTWAHGDWGLDLRGALNGLRSRPMTTLTVVATVALAVGATTSVYSVVHGVLLAPLPYPEPERLARVWQTRAEWGDSPEAEFRSAANRLGPLAPSYYDWLDVDVGFESLGAYVDAGYVLQQPDGAQVLRGQEATPGLFEALAIEPILGRRLQVPDDLVDAAPVVVLSESFWRGRYGGRPDALGTDLVLNGTPHTVVGVMPAGFGAPTSALRQTMLPPGDPMLWTPLSDEARRGWKNVSVIGRLRRGVPIEVASERLAAAQAGMTAVYENYRGAWAEGLLDSIVGDVPSTLWFLLAAVGLVLLVATMNIAGILTASGLTRRREMAVRAALGASWGRLVRVLLVESAAMAAAGGLAGLLLAWITFPLLLRFLPPNLPRHDVIGMSASVMVFGLAVTGLAAILMGTLPAVLAARADPHDAIRTSARTFSSGRAAATVRAGLVVAEVSLAFVLLVGAALLGNSYSRLWSVERGFATEGLVAMRLEPDPGGDRSLEEEQELVRTLTTRLVELPGVRASAVNHLPLSGQRSATTVFIERPGAEPEIVRETLLTVVLDSYLDVVEIPVIAGRTFERGDAVGGPPVAIVSETMARRYWPGETVLGRRLRTFDDTTASLEVIGVAADVRHQGLDVAIAPTVYLPASQSRREINELVLRVRGDIEDAVASARAVIASSSPTTPVTRVTILDEAIGDSVAVPRFRTMLVVGLAGLAAVLALLGVYGVVSFVVAQRTKEIGVRMALGAHPLDEIRRVVGGGFKLGVAGAVLGLGIAWSAADAVAGFLFEITATDAPTYMSVVVGVLALVCVAAYVPARRAAIVDPIEALRPD